MFPIAVMLNRLVVSGPCKCINSGNIYWKLPELKPCIGRFHTAKWSRALMEMIFGGPLSSMALKSPNWILHFLYCFHLSVASSIGGYIIFMWSRASNHTTTELELYDPSPNLTCSTCRDWKIHHICRGSVLKIAANCSTQALKAHPTLQTHFT